MIFAILGDFSGQVCTLRATFEAIEAEGVLTIAQTGNLLAGAEDPNAVVELAREYDEYTEFHGISSRRSGAKVYVEIFLTFDGERSLGSVQETIDRMRTSLEAKIQNSRVLIAPVTELVK